MKRKNKLMEIAGQTFGRLKVLSVRQRRDRDGQLRPWAALACRGGTLFEADANGVFYGRTKSCGCLRQEIGRARLAAWRATRRAAR